MIIYKEIYKIIAKRIKTWDLESFYVVVIKQDTIIGIRRLVIGNYGCVSVNPYKIQTYIQNRGGDGYILVHTHPNKDTSYSFADVSTTNYFKQIIKYKFLGSMIITKNEYDFIPSIWEE